MTQNIKMRCACFQEKCIARATVNVINYVRQLNTSCQGPGSVLRWDSSPSAEVNENINLGYSHDQGHS